MNFTKYGRLIDNSFSPFQRLIMYALQTRMNPSSSICLKMVQRELEVYTKGKPSNKLYHGLRRYLVSGISCGDTNFVSRYIHTYFTLRTQVDECDNTVILIFLLVGCRYKRCIDRLFTVCTSRKITDDSIISTDKMKNIVVDKIIELDSNKYSKIFKRLTFYKYANIVNNIAISELIG